MQKYKYNNTGYTSDLSNFDGTIFEPPFYDTTSDKQSIFEVYKDSIIVIEESFVEEVVTLPSNVQEEMNIHLP